VTPVSDTEFAVNGRYRIRLSFTLGGDGAATGATLNPAPWAQIGWRIADE